MHIAHLETGRHLYGGPRQVLLLMRGLAQLGLRNTLICPPDSAIASAADPAITDIQLLPSAGDFDARFARRLAKWLGDHSPDILHVHSRRGADLWGGLAAKRAAIPALLTRRVDSADLPLIGRVRYRLYDHVVAISARVREQVLIEGVPAESVDLIYSAVDADDCEPAWSRQQFCAAFGLAETDLVAVCAAQFIRRKGHRQLIDAWQGVVEACPQAQLLLFGEGPDEPEIEAQVRRLKLEGSVRFPGFRQDLRAFLGCADLLAHPAAREGLGVILLEAQAAGLPVVAFDAGGIGEAVVANETALLVDPADAGGIQTALIRLFRDPELRAQLGYAGRQRVQTSFAPQHMAQSYLKVYKKLLAAGAGPV
jgi:glycosyltransferase involved in cell wall biosynthesis